MLTFASLFIVFASFPAVSQSRFLDDQFGRSHEAMVSMGKTTVVVTSDRMKGGDEIAAWVKAIGPVAASVVIVPVADLHRMPFFAPRPVVISQLRQANKDTPILLDWTGEISAGLGAAAGNTSVIVYGPTGGLAGKVIGPLSEAGLAELLSLIEKAVSAPR